MKAAHAIIFFILGTVMMMFFYQNELLLFGIMVLSSVACLAFDKWKNTNRFLVALLVGGICENTAVVLGAWSYTNASYLPVPIWLPVGWGMSVILLEEGFSNLDEFTPTFSKKAVVMAFGGTVLTAMSFSKEIGVLIGFVVVTLILFYTKFYNRSELKIGMIAAVFGTIMETVCILAGNWQYSAAMFGTPIWLPLCWFNAFLIMRRLIRFGESTDEMKPRKKDR